MARDWRSVRAGPPSLPGLYRVQWGERPSSLGWVGGAPKLEEMELVMYLMVPLLGS